MNADQNASRKLWAARTLTQAELLAEAKERFGDNPLDWAFECPSCGDVATGNDFSQALTSAPRTNRDGTHVTSSDVIGQECIGRSLGALAKNSTWTGRGCDWAAYGLIPAPWGIVMPDGRTVSCFPLADAPARKAETVGAK